MNNIVNNNYTFNYAGLFRSNGDWIHPKRTEITYEIIYVTSGEVFIREGQKDIRAKKGDLILLSPSVEHIGTRTTRDVSFYWVHFFSEALPFEERFFEKYENSHLFKELLHTCNLPDSPEYLVNSILTHILSELCYLSEKRKRAYDSTAEKIYEWIRINATAKLKVRQISELFGYSADHITRICKKNYGIGACELINKFLIIKAKDLLLNTDKYVKEIAAELGFGDDKSFIGYFKYHEGCFPSELRERYGRIHMNNK